MKKTSLAQKLLNVFQDSEDKNLEGFKAFDEGIAKLKAELRDKIQVNTLDEVNSELDKFKRKIDIDPLIQSVDTLRENFGDQVEVLISQLNDRVAELSNLNTKTANASNERVDELNDEISSVRGQIKDLITQKNSELQSLRENIDVQTESIRTEIKKEISSKVSLVKKDLESLVEDIGVSKKETNKSIEEVNKKFPELRTEIMSRLSERGSGNMNRNIAIGGNTSVLSKFTDINLKAGSNVTITYSNNQTTKYTDVTISATGGGGSVGGVVRSINTVNTSQTMGNTAGTDYVYLCSAGIKIDLPTASMNTNLYTVKNVSNSSVLIAGTIDGDVNGIIMPVQYTSVDLISNDTDWNIT